MSLPSELLIYIVLAGFSLGVIAYNIVLFWCTQEMIYLRFSVALFFYALGISQWHETTQNIFWFLQDWPKETVKLVIDSLNVILFIGFIKYFLDKFVHFQSVHPHLTRLLDLYMAFGVLLIAIYLLAPQPALLTVRTIFVIAACATSIAGLPFYYATVKHLLVFLATILLFCLTNMLLFMSILITDTSGYFGILNNATNVCLFSATLFFLSFPLIITERFSIEQKQREIAQQHAITQLGRFQHLYENALEGLFTATIDGRLLAFNTTLAKLLTLDATLPSKNHGMLQDYFTEQQVVWDKIIALLKTQDVVEAMEIEGYQPYWYSFSARLLMTENGELIEGSLVDISDTKQQALKLAFLAKHDALTNLYNRLEFDQRLQAAIAQPQRYVLLFIDLDQFKIINDSSGHPAGDECLKQVALVLQEQLGQDEMAARLGGDEFALILKHYSTQATQVRAESIRKALENHHFTWYTRSFKITVSIGVLVIDKEIASIAQAVNLADAACYAAKEAGRNCVVLGGAKSDISLHRRSQMDMVNILNQALEENQLTLFKQPVMPIPEGNSCLPWYELLLRLHIGDKIIAPGAFLPAAQRYGLMLQIDRWVFKTACAWLSNPQQRQYIGLLNINLSPQTLSHPDFFAFVKETLVEYAVPPMQLCIEITEYSAINDLTTVLHHIQQLRKFGLRFALDDFGSGFASFDYLKRLPVDFIKIDGQFVRDLKHNATDRALVRAVSDIAHSLGKQVIAEFVEDQETVTILRSFGVDFGQGYHFGAPDPMSGPIAANNSKPGYYLEPIGQVNLKTILPKSA